MPSFKINMLGALLILVLGFLFVTVSSRLTGEVGSSSNPISGMTVATLLITSLIFFALGWVTPPYKVAALSIAAVACIAISNGGTTSQDLKTGYLVGATPSRQQIAILVGSLASALVLGFVILRKLNDAGHHLRCPQLSRRALRRGEVQRHARNTCVAPTPAATPTPTTWSGCASRAARCPPASTSSTTTGSSSTSRTRASTASSTPATTARR